MRLEPDDSTPTHALVVGGTGMLSDVSLWLASRGYMVSVVARGVDRLEELTKRASSEEGSIRPLAVDYRDSGALRTSLAEASTRRGPIELAVCWIHSMAPAALDIVIDALAADRDGGARLIHVRGSATEDPSRLDPPTAVSTLERLGLSYEVVLLGYSLERTRGRWLTDEEIASGVIGAVKNSAKKTVVGTVSPWPMKS